MRRRSTVILALAVAGLSAMGIRTSLRADDVWSLEAVAVPAGEMLRALAGDVHPPLYFLLLAPWVRLFGESETALRGLSILFHLLAAGAVFLIGRRMLGERGAALSAALYGGAPLALLSTELVRMYSLVSLLAALSTLCWLRCAGEEAPARRDWILWCAVNVLGTFAHLWFFCFLAGQAAAAWLHYPSRRRAWVAGYAVSAAPYAALWLPSLARQLSISGETAAWLKRPDLGMLAETAFVHAGFALPAVAVAGLVLLRNRELPGRPPAWLWTAWLVSMLAPLAVSFVKPFFYSRFTIVSLHLTALILAAAMGKAGWRGLPAVAVAAAAILYGGARFQGEECDSRAAARLLAETVRDGDAVVYGSLSRPAVSHYLERGASGRRWFETSFPAEIDRHPGYEGSTSDPARAPELRAEAGRLARQLSTAGAIYVLAGYRPRADAPLLDALAARFGKPAEIRRCRGRGAYYTCVLAYRAASPEGASR